MELGKLIEGAIKVRASDIHLIEDAPPYFRIDDELLPIKAPHVTHAEMIEFVREILPERLRVRLEEKRGADFSYQHEDKARCRVIAFYERRKLALVLRLIPLHVPTLEELELPPVLDGFTKFHRGLLLVTGPTGSGKTTTLASLVDLINQRRRVSIVTIEDPIEYLYQGKLALVTQREIGEDVEDFNSGLVQALRQDPDVVLVGEMRNIETMRTAIAASETGHLVLSTLHTTSAVHTIERIVGTFPQFEHPVLLGQLSTNLRVAVTQELVRRAEGKGRIAALEIMVVTPHVAKLILDHRFDEIVTIMKSNAEGMQTLDEGLARLVQQHKITETEGMSIARDTHAFHRYVVHRESSGDRGGVLG